MCEFKTLHLEPNSGYVLQCKHCGDVTVGFGILTFSRNFAGFIRLIRDVHDCHAYHLSLDSSPGLRNIPFWQLNDCSCLTLSINDLSGLGELLDLAYAKILVENMLSDSFRN